MDKLLILTISNCFVELILEANNLFNIKSPSGFTLLTSFIICFLFSLSCFAKEQTAANTSEQIAINKVVQNSLALFKSFAIQDIDLPSTGVFRKNSNIANGLLIYPFNLSPQWNIITRTILPVVFQPPLVPRQERIQGTSNFVSTAYFTPKHPGTFRWGIGPTLVFPTASNHRLGVREWGGGASIVLVKIGARTVSAVFITQIWSNKNEINERINQFILQPIVNYNFPSGWYLTSAPIITSDWQRRRQQWVIPVGGGVGKIFNLNKIPVNLSAQTFYHVEKPLLVSPWSFRLQAQFFFDTPKWL